MAVSGASMKLQSNHSPKKAGGSQRLQHTHAHLCFAEFLLASIAFGATGDKDILEFRMNAIWLTKNQA